tara:strand:+ start:2589 stop:3845 length:1257 start_codon:yes stop_codon:yes gene_type:complete
MSNHIQKKKILVLSSTFPKNDNDEVPTFVKDQIINLKKEYDFLDFTVIVPKTNDGVASDKSDYFKEIRYHYFWPRRFEVLIGKGIVPTIKKNKLTFFLVPFYFLSQLVVVLKISRQIKPDLIYSHWFTPQGITAYITSVIYKIPFTFTTHAQDVIVLKKIPIIGPFIARIAIKKSSAWTCDSKSTEDRLIKTIGIDNFDKNKSLPVPMAVDSTTYENLLVQSYPSLKSIEGDYNLLFIGRFAEIKGVEYLLRLFKEINSKYPNVNLILGGDGNLRSKYEELINELEISKDKVIFTGYVDKNLKKYLFNISNIKFIPSILSSTGHKEGLPVVLLESLYFGKITMASKFCNAEEVIEDGQSGFLFDPLNIDESMMLFEKVYHFSKEKIMEIENNSKERGKNYTSRSLTKIYFEHLFADFI